LTRQRLADACLNIIAAAGLRSDNEPAIDSLNLTALGKDEEKVVSGMCSDAHELK
jgi:hypothetical protein